MFCATHDKQLVVMVYIISITNYNLRPGGLGSSTGPGGWAPAPRGPLPPLWDLGPSAGPGVA